MLDVEYGTLFESAIRPVSKMRELLQLPSRHCLAEMSSLGKVVTLLSPFS